MKKIKEEKHISLRKHAKKRAKQRYNLELTTVDLKYIVERIQNNIGSKFIYKQSNIKSIYWIMFKDKECIVLYDSLRKEIVTFLPFNCREEFEEKEKKRLKEKEEERLNKIKLWKI